MLTWNVAVPWPLEKLDQLGNRRYIAQTDRRFCNLSSSIWKAQKVGAMTGSSPYDPDRICNPGV